MNTTKRIHFVKNHKEKILGFMLTNKSSKLVFLSPFKEWGKKTKL